MRVLDRPARSDAALGAEFGGPLLASKRSAFPFKRSAVVATLALASGCSSGGAARATTAAPTGTTAQIAAPTPVSSAVPASTSSATTAPPATTTTDAERTSGQTAAAQSTTTSPNAADTAQRAVAERYEAFSIAANECVAVAASCDLPTVLGQFANPDAALYLLYFNRWVDVAENNQRVEHLDRVVRTLVNIQIDTEVANVTACVVDGSVLVDQAGTVVNDRIGYRLEETIWHQEQGTWRLIGGTTYRLDEEGDSQCRF